MFKISIYLKLALLVIVLLAINKNYFVNSHGHHHSHEHGHGHGHHHSHGHGHGHGHHHHGHAHDDEIYNEHDYEHSHEANPAFKYSRAANEKPAASQNQHHGHSHDHGNSHHGHSHDNNQQQQKTNEKRSANEETKKPFGQKVTRDKFTIILHACFSTLLISIAPFLILFFIPLNNNKIENQALLKVLLGFASGSLLGDAFLHLIPHALNPHDHHSDEHSHSHSHSHSDGNHDHSGQTIVGLWVLAGILTFLLVEKAVRHTHSHSHGHSHAKTESSDNDKKNEDKHQEESTDKPKRKDATKEPKESKSETECKEKKSEEAKNEIQVAGYLNLAADFAHNFTDGLAIGASFLAGQNIGIITTLTILFHEVPHEIGDFAILIQSGCTKQKAIFLQLFTALGALTGTLLSLIFESAISGVATSCILPFTAGGFIYIATVSIIPELKESSGFVQSLKEIIALVAGVLMMVVIAYIE